MKKKPSKRHSPPLLGVSEGPVTSSTTPHTLSSPSYSTEGSPSPPTGSSLLKSGMEGLWVVLRALDGFWWTGNGLGS